MFKLNNKGFSLVELMVVVAIIGILSSIAIPSINKYMAKARQSEAKTNLASIYTANKAFFAEYNMYDSYFDAIGYRPEGQLRYNIGWSACTGLANLTVVGFSGNRGTTCNSRTSCTATGLCTSMNGVSTTVTTSPGPATSVTTTGTLGFVAGASGRISASNMEDRWTIDQAKTLQNRQDGTN